MELFFPLRILIIAIRFTFIFKYSKLLSYLNDKDILLKNKRKIYHMNFMKIDILKLLNHKNNGLGSYNYDKHKYSSKNNKSK